MLTFKGQTQYLTSGQGHVIIGTGHVAYQSMRLDKTNTMRPFPTLYLISIKSYEHKHVADPGWPQMTFPFVPDIKWHLGHHKRPKGTLFWMNRADLMTLWGTWFFAHWLIMGWSWKWPDLRSTVWKIRDIQFVDTDAPTSFWKFDKVLSNTLDVTRPQTFCEVGSFDLAWWPDLRWPGVEIFPKVAEKMRDKLRQKRRRCAPPFLRYSGNARGGVKFTPRRRTG